MAKYNNQEALKIYLESMYAAAEEYPDIDLTLLDMLGYHAWHLINEDERSDKDKMNVLWGALLAAFSAGKQRERGDTLPKEFFDLIETLDIDDGPVVDLNDLMGW